MQPIQHETTIATCGDHVTLTTHRLRYDCKIVGQRVVRSIMLDELVSCEMKHTSNLMFLVLAMISFLGAIYVFVGHTDPDSEKHAILAVIVGVILVLVFFLTRRQIISLASAGVTIRFEIPSGNPDEILAFIDNIEHAKTNYR